MRYRRRLRSRIIISFALFGLGLTALFAVATVYMRTRLEDQLVNTTLERELRHFVDFKRENLSPDAQFPMSLIQLQIVRAGRTATVPLAWQSFEAGVYDIEDIGREGKTRPYKLAVYKDADFWAYLRFDVSTQKLGERQLLTVLAASVLAFAVLSLLIGFWLSARVMSPVIELANRVRAMSRSGRPELLKAHFADDEVGQLAAALDDYSTRLTEMVQRDREFNADVSHELRTPLAVIASTTELLQGSPELTDKLRERLRRIERAVRQSSELIDALLLLSRRERQAPTDGETTDVARVVEQVVDAQRPHVANKPVEVRVEIEHRPTRAVETLDCDAVVYATGFDPMPLQELLAEVCAPQTVDAEPAVSRDYRLQTAARLSGAIYLQGGTEHTHGLSSSLLSNIAVRSAEILESISESLASTGDRA